MPKIVDHDRRRKEIATLTLEVMRTQGVESASIRSIAQRGGLSMGVLTHYFKTKDELVVFTFRWLAEQTFRQLERLLDDHRPGLTRLAVAMEYQLPKTGEPAALALWMSLWGRAVRSPAFAREHRDFYRRWRDYVKRFLHSAIDLGEVHARLDVDTTTDLLVAAVDGLWISMTLEPRRFSKTQRQRLLRRIIADLTAAAGKRRAR